MHEQVCIKDNWMQNTRFLTYINAMEKCFMRSPSLLKLCKDTKFCEDNIRQLASRSNHHDAQRVLRRLWEVGDGSNKKHHYVIAAYLQILKYDTSDGCWAVVERVRDRVYRCQSAQKQAFTLVIQHGALSLESSCLSEGKLFSKDNEVDDLIPSMGKTEKIVTRNISSPVDDKILELGEDVRVSYREALQKIHFMAEDFFDEHKENAFKSALHEPARFYFNLCGNSHHRDHVNVHGINGFLCLIRGWFGCQLPLSPMSTDVETFKGCADIWSGLSDTAWEVFKDEANFGKDFEGLKKLRPNMLKNSKYGHYWGNHSFVGSYAGDMEAAARNKDPRYLSYANKFAFFFRKEFLVKRMFEVLNAEGKSEYVGFGKACQVLYPLFKQEHGLREETFLEALYDEDLMHLDVDKAARFFWFCGICNDNDAQITWSVSEKDTCPICYEEKDDVAQIPHWEGKGDISGHKMCSDCTKQYTKNECPFCHDICLKDDILSVINEFIDEVRNSTGSSPNALAALFEMWQIFEMEYATNPKIIHRVAKYVVQDSKFKELLQSGVEYNSGWMRDAAGTIFRLYCLSKEGSLDINSNEKQLLTSSYETIMHIARRGNECGHYYGALYSQAMAPYICALQSGQSTVELEAIIKEVGYMIIQLHKKEKHVNYALTREVPERIIAEYMPIVTRNVWGGEYNDPVWMEFYSK